MQTTLQHLIPTDNYAASYSSNTLSIKTDKIVIGSETFETEQLAQLLKLLLKAHPELRI